MENLTKRGYWIRRHVACLDTDPPEPVVEVMYGDRCVAVMTDCSVLCLSEGFIPATQATDDQVLRAYINDESVF